MHGSLYSSLFTVNVSNDTIQLNNEKQQQQRNAIGTQYTQNSLAYEQCDRKNDVSGLDGTPGRLTTQITSQSSLQFSKLDGQTDRQT